MLFTFVSTSRKIKLAKLFRHENCGKMLSHEFFEVLYNEYLRLKQIFKRQKLLHVTNLLNILCFYIAFTSVVFVRAGLCD